MAETRSPGRGKRHGITQPGGKVLLKGHELVFRQGHQKRFQQYDSFPQAGIQIKMIGVESAPQRFVGDARSIGKFPGGFLELISEIIHHLLQSVGLVKKLGSLGEQYQAKQTAYSGRMLSYGPLEIRRVERFGVGNGSIVLGVVRQGPQQFSQGLGQPWTQFPYYINRLIRFGDSANIAKVDRLVQRNADHCIERFQMLDVGIKYAGFSDRQTGTPIIFDSCASG
jgi:hypothetical protein